MKTRSSWFCAVMTAMSVWIVGATNQAVAQSYPTKPIRVVIPAAPGSNTGFFFRVVSPKMGTILAPQLVGDYRAGAGGMLGATVTTKSPPDGYTVAFVAAGFVMNPSMTENMPCDPTRDFTPLGLVVDVPSVLVTHPSLPVRNLKDPANRKTLLDNGADPLGSTPAEHDAFIKSEVVRWQKVARAAGITPE